MSDNTIRIFAAVLTALSIQASATADELYDQLRDEAWATDSSLAVDLQNSEGLLDLDELIAEVQLRNSAVEVARNTWRAAVAVYPQAKSLPDPMVSYAAGPRTLGDSDQDAAQKFEVSQEFPWPGKRRLRGERALAEADVARLDIETVRSELLRETRHAFHDYWYVHRALTVYAENAELLSTFVDLAESNYAAGATTRQDALQAEVERERLERDSITLRRMLNVSRAQINTLLQREPDAPLAPPAELPPPAPLPDLQRLHEIALEQRPELRAMSVAVEADALGVKIARREFYPDFNVFGAYDAFWQEDELRPMVGASINLPIQLGRRRATVEGARAMQLVSESSLERQRFRVAYEVQEAYEKLLESEQVLRLYKDRLFGLADENLEAAESNYYSTEGDFLALLSAQKEQIDTKLGAYEALASYHQSLADLERAVGGSVVSALNESGITHNDNE